MDSGSFDAEVGIDRFSTSDEVRAALSYLPEDIVEHENDKLWEVASDLGGYVLVDIEHDESLALMEKLDETPN